MSPKLQLTPLSSLHVSKHFLPAITSPSTGRILIPNTSIQNHPLLHYHSPFTFPSAQAEPFSSSGPSNTAASAIATQIESHLRSIGVVEPQWRYGMYPTTHFHSTTHEVLCIYSGRAKLLFGGDSHGGLADDDAKGKALEVVVEVGDVVVIPGGVGHRLLEELDDATKNDGGRGGKRDKFLMVGSYPVGAEGWDMCYGRDHGEPEGSEEEAEEERGKIERIKELGWMDRDPIYGDEGPVVDVARGKGD